MARILIIGGGISGLAAAQAVSAMAPDHRAVLVEREPHLGGKIRTLRSEGFVVEEGPDSFLTRKPGGVELCADVGISDRLLGRSPRGNTSFIHFGGRLHPLPEGFSGLVPSDAATVDTGSLLSEAGRRRMAQTEEVVPPRDAGEESVAAFMTRRFGAEAFERMIEPLVSGIFAGDAHRLSIEAAFPQLVELERRPDSRLRKPPVKRPESGLPPFVSLPGGLSELVEATEARLNEVDVLRGGAARSIGRSARGFSVALDDGTRSDADAVVVALPAGEAAQVLESLSPSLAERHASIEFASTVVVSLAYRSSELPGELDGYGYVRPQVEPGAFHACTWSSSKWPGRAPEGFSLLRLYGGRFGENGLVELSERELLDLSTTELRATLGVRGAPLRSWIRRWPQAIPQYNLGYRGNLRGISEALSELPGLFLAGAAYSGVGIPDCIASGRRAASAAVEYLRECGGRR